MRTLYLSGGISGIPDYRERFTAAAAYLRALGYVVFVPTETFGGDATLDYEAYMHIDLVAVEVCDAIVVLPGWHNSAGAMREAAHAAAMGKPLFPLDEVQPCVSVN